MNDFNFEEKYLKMIFYFVSKYPKYFKEDLKQELLMKLYEILTIKKDIYNLDNYIFISLKNRANDVYKKELQNTYPSLNQKISMNSEEIDFVVDQSTTHQGEYFIDVCNYQRIFEQSLTSKEKDILEEYLFHHIKQKKLAEKYQTTQQNISKVIKKALNKIKNYMN